MATKILGIDVSNKSPEELRKIVKKLGLDKLTDQDMKKLMDFPENIRRNWIDKPDQTGGFTSESISMLHTSMQFQKQALMMHPILAYEKQIGEVMTQRLRNRIYLIDEAGDALYEQMMESLKDGLDLVSAKTGYTHTDVAGMSQPDLERDGVNGYITIGFRDGTEVKDFKFKLPEMEKEVAPAPAQSINKEELFEATRKANKEYNALLDREHTGAEEVAALQRCNELMRTIQDNNLLPEYDSWSDQKNFAEQQAKEWLAASRATHTKPVELNESLVSKPTGDDYQYSL